MSRPRKPTNEPPPWGYGKPAAVPPADPEPAGEHRIDRRRRVASDVKPEDYVRDLVTFGVPRDKIAARLGMSHVTLDAHYSDVIKAAEADAGHQVGKFIFRSITEGLAHQVDPETGELRLERVGMRIRASLAVFYARSKLGWKDQIEGAPKMAFLPSTTAEARAERIILEAFRTIDPPKEGGAELTSADKPEEWVAK